VSSDDWGNYSFVEEDSGILQKGAWIPDVFFRAAICCNTTLGGFVSPQPNSCSLCYRDAALNRAVFALKDLRRHARRHFVAVGVH